jgi:hypothetical protein
MAASLLMLECDAIIVTSVIIAATSTSGIIMTGDGISSSRG